MSECVCVFILFGHLWRFVTPHKRSHHIIAPKLTFRRWFGLLKPTAITTFLATHTNTHPTYDVYATHPSDLHLTYRQPWKFDSRQNSPQFVLIHTIYNFFSPRLFRCPALVLFDAAFCPSRYGHCYGISMLAPSRLSGTIPTTGSSYETQRWQWTICRSIARLYIAAWLREFNAHSATVQTEAEHMWYFSWYSHNGKWCFFSLFSFAYGAY